MKFLKKYFNIDGKAAKNRLWFDFYFNGYRIFGIDFVEMSDRRNFFFHFLWLMVAFGFQKV